MSSDRPVLNALLGTIGDAVVLADLAGRPLRVNTAFEALTGFREDEFISGMTDNAEVAREAVSAAITAGSGRRILCVRWSNGTVRRTEITVRPVVLPSPAADLDVAFVATVRPMDQAEETRAGPRFGYDPLTGLPGRDLFLDRVEQSVLQTYRTGGSVALLIMGLDRFTLVNDALGHQAGDQILIEVSRRLRQSIREADTVVRLEGDRFALVMVIADEDDTVIVAEKVLAAINDPFTIEGSEVVLTFSIGIALYPMDAADAPHLIKQAENALHHAKIGGRNQYRFFAKDMNRKAKARLELEARMRRALVHDEFEVYYQPKVRAEDGEIVGAEALIRWNDPDYGLISPTEFIPVAEETGLIKQIGAWVLRQTCLQNQTWQDQGLTPVRIAVNVSARQFRDRNFVDVVVNTLEESGLDPSWLDLEITESMLMHDIDAAVEKMTLLRTIGVGLSIDDFGTGYSSLSYLGHFPITTLKIDRAFITDVDTNPKTAEIARAIIGLSKGLNLEVVAEGCEVAEHVLFLKEHGCHTVQGFLYSRPVPALEFELMLRGKILFRHGVDNDRPVLVGTTPAE
jgi:diguanylate cyclase (GGDEF)-like protein